MSTVAELRCQAELPQWMLPLAQEIAGQIQADLQSNTQALLAVQKQLQDLIEVQVTFLETLQSAK
jgi:hypothetical protein